MSGDRRLPHKAGNGSVIDRSRPLQFSFNGRSYRGFFGDTLASALLANGVGIVGRSFKYHRPRGIFGYGAEESNALVQLGTGDRTEPNLKATEVALFDGLAATSVNAWPSPGFDLRAVNQLFAPLLPAGFYYKTFKWPSWATFEGSIRRAAGLGVAPSQPDPDRYEHLHVHCDLLVVGAGPAGLAAALAAGLAGRQVVLAEQGPQLGGSLLDDDAGDAWKTATVARLRSLPNVRLQTRLCVFGYYDHNALAAVQQLDAVAGQPRQRLWKLRAGQVILATGAIERPLVFAGNDRPGIMLASAAASYLHRHDVLCGRSIVLFTNNSSAYPVAAALCRAGAAVTVIDARPEAGTGADAAMAAGVVVRCGHVIRGALGRARVKAVQLATAAGGDAGRIGCDLLLMSGGWSPVVHLFSQSGGSLRFDELRAMFVPDRTVQPVQVIGAANGTMSMAEGFREALAAVAVAADAIEAPPADTMPPYRILPLWQVPGSGKAFVDFANDVTAGDVALAARENYVSVEHLKRYTTLGMGIDQGKTSNVNGLAIMGERTGRAPAAVGTTRFRPPYAPVTIGTYAGTQVGQMYRPLRYLPAHAFHLERGAVLEEFGGWLRPTAYLQHGEDWEAAARREAGAVRAGVGLFDGSPLGKIEVSGPDAGRFLDRIYVGTASTLKPGRARYGLMLNENGIVVDDGVFIRRDQDSFLVHTTSGGAERIAGVLEEWLQCEWVDLDVTVVQVTAQWANMTISGPNARQLLQAVGTDIDLAADSFAHMSYREGTVAGCEARIARVSYTGEISFEISVAAGKGEWLARLLWQHGEPIGLVPYGIEALMILRTEKGYLHVGVDTEGTTLPDDIGMAGPIAKKASDFVGRRSLSRSDALRKDRLQLVGLLAGDASRLHPGAHIMGGATVPCPIDGYVTSSADSPTLHHPIALALVRNGRRRLGETVEVYDMGVTRQARIVDTVFFDKEGARLHG